MDQATSSLSRLASSYSALVAPSVSPSVLNTNGTMDIFAQKAHSRALPGGVSTRQVSQRPFDAVFTGDLAGPYDPARFSREQLALFDGMPASEPDTNPTMVINRKSYAVKLGQLIQTGLTDAEMSWVLPIPEPCSLTWLFSPRKVSEDYFTGQRPVYSITAHELNGQMDFPIKPRQGPMAAISFDSVQEQLMLDPVSLNFVSAMMEREHYYAANTADEYEEGFKARTAESHFFSYFTLDGVVRDDGAVAATHIKDYKQTSAQDDTRTAGVGTAKVHAVITAGQAECFDYLQSMGNVEGASLFVVVYRQPIKRGTVSFEVSFDLVSKQRGMSKRPVEFVPNTNLAGSIYADTMYPLQHKYLAWPDGDNLPDHYISRHLGPHMHGAVIKRIGTIFFRNHGNLGKQPHVPRSLGYHMRGPNYVPPATSIEQVKNVRSNYELTQLRRINVMLNGNIHH